MIFYNNVWKTHTGYGLEDFLMKDTLVNNPGSPEDISALKQRIQELEQSVVELRNSEKKYRELSTVDKLTQLYNHRQFYAQLKTETDRSKRYEQPLTLLFIDIDDFKTFNDTYGHIEGDKVLQRIGPIIKSCLRETDLPYRYGGEEFTVILPMTMTSDGVIIAERINSEIKKEAFSPLPGQIVHVTVSIGVAQYEPQEDMKVFVHRVDRLMYKGKRDGKDRICHESCSFGIQRV